MDRPKDLEYTFNSKDNESISFGDSVIKMQKITNVEHILRNKKYLLLHTLIQGRIDRKE